MGLIFVEEKLFPNYQPSAVYTHTGCPPPPPPLYRTNACAPPFKTETLAPSVRAVAERFTAVFNQNTRCLSVTCLLLVATLRIQLYKTRKVARSRENVLYSALGQDPEHNLVVSWPSLADNNHHYLELYPRYFESTYITTVIWERYFPTFDSVTSLSDSESASGHYQNNQIVCPC
jgi:hypothetical protein